MLCCSRILFALAIAGAPASASADSRRSDAVVHGTVMMGPTCPGPARRDQPACQLRPLPATVKVFALRNGNATDAPAATIATDRNGRFSVSLAPGTYRLVPGSPDAISRGKPHDVAVTAGTTVELRLLVDSGLR
jgi:hypothetical protein